MLQKVVGDEAHRAFPSQRRSHLLATETSLQHIKSQRRIVLFSPADDLTVEHGTIGQGRSNLDQFRKAVVDQLFPATPQIDPSPAVDQLTADAIPFPFQLPVFGRLFTQPIRLQRTGR